MHEARDDPMDKMWRVTGSWRIAEERQAVACTALCTVAVGAVNAFTLAAAFQEYNLTAVMAFAGQRKTQRWSRNLGPWP